MSLATSSVIGTICVEPQQAMEMAAPTDDSTLGLLLASYARHDSLSDEPAEFLLVASARVSRLAALGDRAVGVRANLAQLLDDLQTEYDQLSGRLEV